MVRGSVHGGDQERRGAAGTTSVTLECKQILESDNMLFNCMDTGMFCRPGTQYLDGEIEQNITSAILGSPFPWIGREGLGRWGEREGRR